jgi:hypothetical protein
MSYNKTLTQVAIEPTLASCNKNPMSCNKACSNKFEQNFHKLQQSPP